MVSAQWLCLFLTSTKKETEAHHDPEGCCGPSQLLTYCSAMVLKTCLVLCQQEVPLTFRKLALLKLQVNFPWDDFYFPFTLLQVGLAPERAEPSGWQGTEQKVTLAELVLQLPPAFPSSQHTEVFVFT